MNDFADYLTAPPTIPASLPQSIISFLVRAVVPERSLSAVAIITQALEKVTDPSVAPVVLDIDVFKETPEGIRDEDIFRNIEQLRNFKNKIFFESITEKLKELYL